MTDSASKRIKVTESSAPKITQQIAQEILSKCDATPELKGYRTETRFPYKPEIFTFYKLLPDGVSVEDLMAAGCFRSGPYVDCTRGSSVDFDNLAAIATGDFSRDKRTGFFKANVWEQAPASRGC